MKTRVFLAMAVGLLALCQQGFAQQQGYPTAANQPAPSYVFLPGYAMPAAYMAPGAHMAPGVGMPVAAPLGQAVAASQHGDASACDDCDCGCPVYGWRAYGEYLYLRPRNAEVPYAVPIDGPIRPQPTATPIEVGPVALLNPDYHSAYRFGFGWSMDECSSIGADYTRFDSETTSSVEINPTRYALRSLVIHPSTLNATGDFETGAGRYELNYQMADLNYRHTFACGEGWSADCQLGVRYARLQQAVVTDFSYLGVQEVSTSVDFDGAGPKIGLLAERHGCRWGLMVYGRGEASFLVGDFTARYAQTDVTAAQTLVETSWKSGRIVPILELELGAGWCSPGGRVRLTGGYLVSGWYNVVKTADFVDAVQRANFNHLGNVMTFDGLVGRAEIRF